MMGTMRRIITVLHVSVVSARIVLAIIRDNFLYIIIINIINQQSNAKNADNTRDFLYKMNLTCIDWSLKNAYINYLP